MLTGPGFVFQTKNSLASFGRSQRTFMRLADQQYWAIEELDALNFSKREEIVRFAYEHSVFYRELYDAAGVHPNDIRTPSDFEALPIVTRDHIRDRYADIVTKHASIGRARRVTTGGSTGEPVSLLNDRRVRVEANLRRVVGWWGIEPYDNAAYIYRMRRSQFHQRLNDVAWWPTRRIFLDASLMSPALMNSFIQKYQEVRPALVQGYVGAVYEFASFLRAAGITIPSPKAVWVTAAPLSESQRLFIQDALGAPVYDQYGSCEIPWLASECSMREGLHMIHDLRFIEFLNESWRPVVNGEWGRVAVTDLENRVFPLIRYSLGDMGRRLDRECNCGIGLPLMDKVRGRETDRVLLPGGRVVSGEYLTTIFDSHPEAVKAFQVHQLGDGSIDLICVPTDHPQATQWIREARDGLQEKIGRDVSVSIKETDEIHHVGGKLRYVVSDVRPAFKR